MSSKTETGHAKNVANFAEILSRIATMGTAYAPSNPAYALSALQTQHTEAKNALDQMIDRNTAFNNAVNKRMDQFGDLRALGSRIVSAVRACNPGEEIIKDALAINRKLNGRRATELAPVPADAQAPKSISVSQQSYDSLIQHFKSLISLVTTITNYTPNEPELNPTGLAAKLSLLESSNEATTSAFSNLLQARKLRFEVLYKKDSGLIDTGKGVKNYIHSAFGKFSAEYRSVSGIRLRNIRY